MKEAEELTTRASVKARWRGYLDIAASVIMVLAGVGVLLTLLQGHYLTGTRPSAGGPSAGLKVPTEPLSVADAPAIGSQSAPVALIEYADFQCPFCGQFARSTLPSLVNQYVKGGRVLVVFRDFPLPAHPFARPAAEAAACAGEQGRFWQAHDALFADQAHLAQVTASLASSLRLSEPRFESCLATVAKGRVDRELADGIAIHVGGTPAFLIGRRRQDGQVAVATTMTGAQPLAEFEKSLDSALRSGAAPEGAIRGKQATQTLKEGAQ